MKTVRRNSIWAPSFFTENKLDLQNYESFSIPKVNIKEDFTNFVVEMAVPGLKKENFSIEVEKEVLKVSSSFSPKREPTDTDKDTQFTRKEFNYGSFMRNFTLPELVESEKIIATYRDGILTISLPKKEGKENIKRMVEIS